VDQAACRVGCTRETAPLNTRGEAERRATQTSVALLIHRVNNSTLAGITRLVAAAAAEVCSRAALHD
jgi:hypothetical protein